MSGRTVRGVQISCLDDLSLHPWAPPFGRPMAVQIVYPDDLSSHHLVSNAGWLVMVRRCVYTFRKV